MGLLQKSFGIYGAKAPTGGDRARSRTDRPTIRRTHRRAYHYRYSEDIVSRSNGVIPFSREKTVSASPSSSTSLPRASAWIRNRLYRSGLTTSVIDLPISVI